MSGRELGRKYSADYFGGRCNDVYDELEKIVHITETEANGEKSIVKKQSVWAVVIDYIANSIQPVVPILIASGFYRVCWRC